MRMPRERPRLLLRRRPFRLPAEPSSAKFCSFFCQFEAQSGEANSLLAFFIAKNLLD
jgi:hypothetical protein